MQSDVLINICRMNYLEHCKLSWARIQGKSKYTGHYFVNQALWNVISIIWILGQDEVLGWKN